MAISPDGSTLAVGSFGSDGVVSLWRMPQRPWDELACVVANRDLSAEERTQYLGDFPAGEVCPRPEASASRGAL